MPQSEILQDLDYVRTLAEEGRNAPLIGGRIGLWWGILLCITLFCHWMIVTGVLPYPPQSLGMLWMIFGVAGCLGSVILGKTISDKPGVLSANNRVSHAMWTGNTFFLFVFGFAAGISAALGVNDFDIMNIMMPLAFGLYGLTAFVMSKISGETWHLIPSGLAFFIMVISLFMLSSPHLLLVAIAGVICTIIIPNIINLRREPKAVV